MITRNSRDGNSFNKLCLPELDLHILQIPYWYFEMIVLNKRKHGDCRADIIGCMLIVRIQNLVTIYKENILIFKCKDLYQPFNITIHQLNYALTRLKKIGLINLTVIQKTHGKNAIRIVYNEEMFQKMLSEYQIRYRKKTSTLNKHTKDKLLNN